MIMSDPIPFDARPCAACGGMIHACMGFTKAGDVLAIEAGTRTERPRELCGLCSEVWIWNVGGDLVPNPRPFEGLSSMSAEEVIDAWRKWASMPERTAWSAAHE